MIEYESDIARFFDLSQDLLCIANTNGYFEKINSAFTRILGYSQDDILSTPFVDFIHPDDVISTMNEVSSLAQGIPTVYFENRYRCLDSTYKWLAWTVTPDGDKLYAVGRDITGHKQIQETLRRSEAQFRRLVETAPGAILVINVSGQIVLINERVVELFGYSQVELIGKDIEILLPEHLHDVHHVHRGGFFTQPEARPMGIGRDLSGRRRDGTVFPIEIGLSSIITENGLLALAFITDITERKQLLDELAKMNKDLKDFAYVVSHDLKAPLRGISSVANWISSDYTDVLDADGQELLDLLQSRVFRLQNLIEGILRYSQVGRIEDEWESVNLQEIVDDVMTSLVRPEHISLVIDDALPTLYGSRVRLEQVFHNLLSNAIKFMDKPQGIIKIESIRKESFWEFRVTDNGPGIDERHFAKIFQIFQTLNPRDDVESTGIGLTLVKRIVELHHGTISVQSEVGKGTTFIFTVATGSLE